MKRNWAATYSCQKPTKSYVRIKRGNAPERDDVVLFVAFHLLHKFGESEWQARCP